MLKMNKAQLFVSWLDGQLDGVTECDSERTNRIKEKLESIFEKHADNPVVKPKVKLPIETLNLSIETLNSPGTLYRC